jgi:glycosyltransferase involved in cell wall biosynthesis
MKISLLTQYYKPEIGAPQNRLLEMCVGLRNLGVDISVITGMPNYPSGEIFDEYKGKIFHKEIIDGIEVCRYWLYASNSRKILPRVLNMISFSVSSFFSFWYLLKRKCDYIIVESPPLALGITGYLLSRITKSKLIMNISDLWPLSASELGVLSQDSLVYGMLSKLERFLYRRSYFCMGQSQEIVDYILSHGANDVYLFRNGVDPQRFEKALPQKKYFNKHDSLPIKIVYAGLLGYAQGILGICENINFKCLGSEFHIYGAGGEQKQIEEFLLRNPNRGIYYHGKVCRDQVPGVLSGADCTLIPLVNKIYGAVPSKIYESMAAGLPILFSGDGEGRKIVEDNVLGLTSPAMDYLTLSKNILRLYESKDALANYSNNCVMCARTKFNRPEQIKALCNKLLQFAK